MRTFPLLTVLATLAACKSDTGITGDTGDTDTSDDTDTGVVVDGCRAAPASGTGDGPKVVVISHPYDTDGARSNVWERFTLDGDELTSTNTTFTMGRGQAGRVAWAPDGSIAAAVQDDGTLGLFTPDGTVIEAAYDGGFYAVDAVFDATGERLFVVDGNWVENGGGVYEVAIDCASGEPSIVGEIVEAKLGAALLGDVLVADSQVARIDVDAGTLGAGTDLFDYADSIIGGADRHGNTVYAGDYSEFSGEDNHVAVVDVSSDTFAISGLVALLDPYAIAAVDDGALVSSGYGDEIVGITAEGIADRLSSELPGAMAHGPDGLVLVAQVSDVRLVRFDGASLDDVDTVVMGAGLEDMPGSIGVQP